MSSLTSGSLAAFPPRDQSPEIPLIDTVNVEVDGTVHKVLRDLSVMLGHEPVFSPLKPEKGTCSVPAVLIWPSTT